jgi:carboxyl-terminal processing protease
MQTRHRILGLAVGSALVINLLVGVSVHSDVIRESGDDSGYASVRQMMSVLQLIRKNYVDEEKVGYQPLIRGALQGMLTSLDRFSSYIPPEQYGKMQEETEGEFGGIGIVISVKDDILTVVAPMEDSPGMKAGLRPKDQIVKVNGVDTLSVPLDQAVGMIKGEPGTSVALTVYRPGSEETLEISVERAIIEIATVKDTHYVEEGVGYVRITQFNEKTGETLRAELMKLTREGKLTALVMDLRNNPGGLLNSAVEVCSLFVPTDQLIVYTQGREPSHRSELFSRPGGKFLNLPIAILVNEGSASAAEIVAGCLQHYRVALLVGEKTFGKGSVQSIIELGDESAIRLTTAYYFTPSEKRIHGIGIEPDYVVDIGDDDTYKLYLQRTRVQEADDENTELMPDPQLQRAIEVLTGVKTMISPPPAAADAVGAPETPVDGAPDAAPVTPAAE